MTYPRLLGAHVAITQPVHVLHREFGYVAVYEQRGRRLTIRYDDVGDVLDADLDGQLVHSDDLRCAHHVAGVFALPVATRLNLADSGPAHAIGALRERFGGDLPRVLLLCGPPAAGKSSLAAALRDTLGWTWVDKDVDGDVLSPSVMTALGHPADERDHHDYRRYARPVAMRLLADAAARAVDAGHQVVIEAPFLSEVSAAHARSVSLPAYLVAEQGWSLPVPDSRCVWVTADSPIRRHRMRTRNLRRDDAKLADWGQYLTVTPEWPADGAVDAVVTVT